jgi:two-component system phosphate regulon response regulator PhoB
MNKARILLIEDQRDIADMVAWNLRKAGFDTHTHYSGGGAMEALAQFSPDLVILDLMLPQVSGKSIAAQLRAQPTTSNIPIIMLTAKASEAEQIEGLEQADDYITKPFSMSVLVSRVGALLRRTESLRSQAGQQASIGGVVLDANKHEVRARGESVHLTLTEFRILQTLLKHREKVVSRKDLVRAAIGPNISVTERTIDVHMTALRRKLGEEGRLIQTVRGVGYRISEFDEAAESSR